MIFCRLVSIVLPCSFLVVVGWCGVWGSHTVVLSADGKVYTFGRGDHGRLGIGSKANSYVPVVAHLAPSCDVRTGWGGRALECAQAPSPGPVPSRGSSLVTYAAVHVRMQGVVTSPVNPLRVLVPRLGGEAGYDTVASPRTGARSLAPAGEEEPVVVQISAGGTHTLALVGAC